jgi:carbon-monoxide dehydrogenase large subunit
MQHDSGKAGQGVGVSMRRVEDRRFLEGKGEYLADLEIPGTLELAFLRSPVANAVLNGVAVPDACRGQVFLAGDIDFVKPIIAVSKAPGFNYSEYPPLAKDRLRFVGEMVAMCIAPTRALAEDVAHACSLDVDERPAVWDMEVALRPGRAARSRRLERQSVRGDGDQDGRSRCREGARSGSRREDVTHGPPCRRVDGDARRPRPLR